MPDVKKKFPERVGEKNAVGQGADLMTPDTEFIQRCAAAGFSSPSPGKLEIARRALAMKSPFTAEEFCQIEEEEVSVRFSRAAAYRTLGMLERVGMIRREGDLLSVITKDSQ